MEMVDTEPATTAMLHNWLLSLIALVASPTHQPNQLFHTLYFYVTSIECEDLFVRTKKKTLFSFFFFHSSPVFPFPALSKNLRIFLLLQQQAPCSSIPI